MAQFNLPEPQPDPLLQLIGQYRSDTRANKIDLGVGVYRDDYGNTPVLKAVKEAESQLQQQQQSKSYLGLTGDTEFVECLAKLIFGDSKTHALGAQTPGGSGALRLAAEIYKTAYPDGTLWIGEPTWPNHIPLTESARVRNTVFPYFDQSSQKIQFDKLLEAADTAASGDAMLLHGCCHNPTGADLSMDQWQELTDLMVRKNIVPIIDLAYHGLGSGLHDDLLATRLVVTRCEQSLVAASCSKNFGLYRDRTGAVFMASQDKQTASRAQAVFGQIARTIYSMPPDHGAAVVRIILQDESLKQQWINELDSMVQRINGLRAEMAATCPALEFVAGQRGMFSLLPLSHKQVDSLINDHAVYMAGNGRANVAGCQKEQIPNFVSALQEVGFIGVSAS